MYSYVELSKRNWFVLGPNNGIEQPDWWFGNFPNIFLSKTLAVQLISRACGKLKSENKKWRHGVERMREASTARHGSLTLQSRCDVRARMGGAGWARGEARVADDSDFETLRTLLSSDGGWTLEYEKDGVKVWAEDAAHGALRTVKVRITFLKTFCASSWFY